MFVNDIRKQFFQKWLDKDIISGRGGDTIEIVGASFIANEPLIFGVKNQNYIDREIEWYKSQSLSLKNFPGGAPTQWLATANSEGDVNSNYGWCLDSFENGSQRENVIAELLRNPTSRRAQAIYNRPSMHDDATEDGKQDFICTNAVQYLLRGGKLSCVVQMRSSDVVYGYQYDFAWHQLVLKEIADVLKVEVGDIYWQAGSLHIYERHFRFLRDL